MRSEELGVILNTMKVYKKLKILVIVWALGVSFSGLAQWPSRQSVLAEHEWYKIGVTEDGVYGLDYAFIQSLGIDPQQIDPAKIRLFSNVQGPLPELNSRSRYDDLSEAAIVVTGADDGSFDEGDQVLFYGQGPVNLTVALGNYFTYERNPFTDTTYYYLCFDSGTDGLRVGEQASAATSDSASVVDSFLECYYHESEELSPYASGRTWYGDLITGQEGFKEFQVEIPGLVFDRGVRVNTKILGRCKPAATYDLTLNGESVVDGFVIDAYKSREYGKEHWANKLTHPDSETVTLRYEFTQFEGNPLLFIDYFLLNYWRELRCYGSDLAFTVLPSQMTVSPALVEIAGAESTMVCWEVTDPIHPVRQLMLPQETGMCFGLGGVGEHRFSLFQIDAVKPVASCRPIPNQNLHGLETAEMLIITPRVFWAQAQALADFHAENDGMDCVLADVAEIFNEFGTGTPDPTAVRDFIRMVYLRSGGDLKYVLLMGKGTHDYRNLKGMDNNFIPTYETAGRENYETESMCTDDYFALMDESEGETCNGRVDLGVGRLPITTPEQGDALL